MFIRLLFFRAGRVPGLAGFAGWRDGLDGVREPAFESAKERASSMAMALQLHEGQLPASGDPVYLLAVERVVYVIEGNVTVQFADGCCRWELVASDVAHQDALQSAPGTSSSSELKLSAEVEPASRSGWLVRCGRVSFPKGRVAYTCVHQRPGIRCCLEGRIEIRTEEALIATAPASRGLKTGPRRCWHRPPKKRKTRSCTTSAPRPYCATLCSAGVVRVSSPSDQRIVQSLGDGTIPRYRH